MQARRRPAPAAPGVGAHSLAVPQQRELRGSRPCQALGAGRRAGCIAGLGEGGFCVATQWAGICWGGSTAPAAPRQVLSRNAQLMLREWARNAAPRTCSSAPCARARRAIKRVRYAISSACTRLPAGASTGTAGAAPGCASSVATQHGCARWLRRGRRSAAQRAGAAGAGAPAAAGRAGARDARGTARSRAAPLPATRGVWLTGVQRIAHHRRRAGDGGPLRRALNTRRSSSTPRNSTAASGRPSCWSEPPRTRTPWLQARHWESRNVDLQALPTDFVYALWDQIADKRAPEG